MMKGMNENPRKWEGRKILFIHTGGLLGLYDKAEDQKGFYYFIFIINKTRFYFLQIL